MYHPTTRVLAVLALLRSHGRMTGAELAQRLQVNSRTLRRYITMLQDLGVPIVAERGRNGAYEMDSGFKLPPMMFTNDEAVALALGLLAAQHLGLDETIHAIESARAKLEQVMPLELKSRLRALTETITLDLSAVAMPSSNEVMLTMSSAAQLQRGVHMRYRSRLNDETEREFDPYGLAYRHGRWYVVGHCHLRHGLRSFRLDRVVQLEQTETHFDRPEHFDAAAHILQAIATLPRQFTFEVLLRTDSLTAQHEICEMLGLLEPCEEGVLLRGTVDDMDWLALQLARLPFAFVVREPEPLRAALRRRAEALMSLAASD
jgi:predicted DNA-binding transcriptional regulator YafY